MALILNSSPNGEQVDRLPSAYNRGADWTRFTQLSIVQLAVDALTPRIQSNIKMLLSGGRALQEVILTSDKVVRASDMVQFLLTELRRRTTPILRLQLPMLMQDHIDEDNVFQFLQHQQLLEELCIPVRRLLQLDTTHDANDFQHVHNVYFSGLSF